MNLKMARGTVMSSHHKLQTPQQPYQHQVLFTDSALHGMKRNSQNSGGLNVRNNQESYITTRCCLKNPSIMCSSPNCQTANNMQSFNGKAGSSVVKSGLSESLDPNDINDRVEYVEGGIGSSHHGLPCHKPQISSPPKKQFIQKAREFSQQYFQQVDGMHVVPSDFSGNGSCGGGFINFQKGSSKNKFKIGPINTTQLSTNMTTQQQHFQQ